MILDHSPELEHAGNSEDDADIFSGPWKVQEQAEADSTPSKTRSSKRKRAKKSTPKKAPKEDEKPQLAIALPTPSLPSLSPDLQALIPESLNKTLVSIYR